MSESKIAADAADNNFVHIKSPLPFLDAAPSPPFLSRISRQVGSACRQEYRTDAEIEHHHVGTSPDQPPC
jgi:hypothetical protein